MSLKLSAAVVDQLAPDQICRRCSQPLDRHASTPLGAIACIEWPHNAGLARWADHGFVTRDGQPYLSLLEQIGALAGLLEERGLPEGREPVLEGLRRLQDRVAALAGPRAHRLEGAALPGLLKDPHPEVPLGLYRHYKGQTYVVIGGILMASGEGEEILVAYMPVVAELAVFTLAEYLSCRTLADWQAPVTVVLPGGAEGLTPRFTLVERLTAAVVHRRIDAACMRRVDRAADRARTLGD